MPRWSPELLTAPRTEAGLRRISQNQRVWWWQVAKGTDCNHAAEASGFVGLNWSVISGTGVLGALLARYGEGWLCSSLILAGSPSLHRGPHPGCCDCPEVLLRGHVSPGDCCLCPLLADPGPVFHRPAPPPPSLHPTLEATSLPHQLPTAAFPFLGFSSSLNWSTFEAFSTPAP